MNHVTHSLSSADASIFHRKSANFAISINTHIDCILIHFVARYGLEILHQCGKRVKIESQKVLRSTLVEVTGEKSVVGSFSVR